MLISRICNNSFNRNYLYRSDSAGKKLNSYYISYIQRYYSKKDEGPKLPENHPINRKMPFYFSRFKYDLSKTPGVHVAVKSSHHIDERDMFDWKSVKKIIFSELTGKKSHIDVKDVSYVSECLPDEYTTFKEYGDSFIEEISTDYDVNEYQWKTPVLPKPKPILKDIYGGARGTGKRKKAVAFVTIYLGEGKILINGRHWLYYFKHWYHRAQIIEPLLVTNTLNKWNIKIEVHGGGYMGQTEAIQLGIARALIKFDPEYRPPLAGGKYIKRDSRVVERKKAGRKKSRKGFQWVKR